MRLGVTKWHPRKLWRVQIDDCGVECLENIQQIDFGIFRSTMLERLGDVALCELCIDTPIALQADNGKHASWYWRVILHAIKLDYLRRMTNLYDALDFAIHQLCQGHDMRLFVAQQHSHSVIADIQRNNPRRHCLWGEIRHLCKQGPVGIHEVLSGMRPPSYLLSACSRPNRYCQKMMSIGGISCVYFVTVLC